MTKEIDISTVGRHAKVLIEGDTVNHYGWRSIREWEEPEVLKNSL
jgi:hypothetical protein